MKSRKREEISMASDGAHWAGAGVGGPEKAETLGIGLGKGSSRGRVLSGGGVQVALGGDCCYYL